jgi:transposase-like protein
VGKIRDETLRLISSSITSSRANGPICPHCGGFERIGKLKGKSTRPGVYKCYQCRKPFRVTVGAVFEASRIPLRLWLQAVHLMASSKKGISSNQLHRTLGVTLKTAWFMSHPIREQCAWSVRSRWAVPARRSKSTRRRRASRKASGSN